MKTEPNEPISPIPMVDEDGNHYIDKRNYGLTKREKFAESAMVGLLASITLGPLPVKIKMQLAVECTDELINQLNKENNDNTKKD